MSLMDASEDSTPSTAPMDTLIDGDDKAREIKSASTPLSLSAAKARRAEREQGNQRENFEAGKELRHKPYGPHPEEPRRAWRLEG